MGLKQTDMMPLQKRWMKKYSTLVSPKKPFLEEEFWVIYYKVQGI